MYMYLINCCNLLSIKCLNVQTPNKFAVNTKTQRLYHGVMLPKDADGTANSEHPDQTVIYALFNIYEQKK